VNWYKQGKNIYLTKWISAFILSLLLCPSYAFLASKKCKNAQLTIYADSVKKLNLSYQPYKVFPISDSLASIYVGDDCPEMVNILSAKANAFELIFNFESALAIYNDLLKIAIAQNYSDSEIEIRLSLARVHETISRPEFCLENLNQAKKLIDAHNLTQHLSRYYVRLASYQRIYKDKKLAVENAQLAVELGKQHKVKRSEADGNLILGLVTEDFETSIAYTKESAKLFYELEDYTGAMYQEINIAHKYLKVDAYDDLMKTLTLIEDYTEKINHNEKVYYQFKGQIYRIKAQFYEKTNNKDSLISALKNHNIYSGLFGKVVNQEQINHLLLDNALKEERDKIATAKKLNYFLFFSLLALSLIVFLLLRMYYLNKLKKNKIQQQASTIRKQFDELTKVYNYQTTLLSEVHHRIKNNLQLIISLVTIQKSKLKKNVDTDIFDMLSHRISGISLIHEQLYASKEFDTVNVELYIKSLLKNFISLISEKNIVLEHEMNNIQLNLETITPLGLIWCELISNSLKYNSDINLLRINFDLQKKGDLYFMHYYDNGAGYPTEKFKANESGMGYTIINSLSRQLSAKAKSYNSNGAHYTLEFKEKIISAI